jgi:hypothetical protein
VIETHAQANRMVDVQKGKETDAQSANCSTGRVYGEREAVLNQLRLRSALSGATHLLAIVDVQLSLAVTFRRSAVVWCRR